MTAIDKGIPPPEANKKASKRGRKKKITEPQSTTAAGLIKALQFVGLAQRSAGTSHQTHCLMNNGWCVAFDEVFTIGCKIEENISACPKTQYLLDALQKCGEQIAIAQLSEYVLSVKSGKFKASIPCVGFDAVPATGPDAPIAVITDELRAGFETCGWLVHEGEQEAYKAALLLQGGSIVGSNGSVLLEYWHGIDLPPGLLIPSKAVNAIVKIKKPLTRFGFSATSATFYFDDESFLKTQLFDARYPNYKAVFDKGGLIEAAHLPTDFFKGLQAVRSFSEDKFVFLTGDKIQSNTQEELGATYDLPGIPINFAFNQEMLAAIEPHFKSVAFHEAAAYFKNGKVRGVIMGGSHYEANASR